MEGGWSILKEIHILIRAIRTACLEGIEIKGIKTALVTERESNWCFHDRKGLWLPTFI